jgi:tripartite-type tricarboxylate transporter receptor subunit TctC
MFVDLPPALPFIREGKMRALGVSSIAAVPAAPEIPPLAQAGVPGYDAGGWLMFVAPARTPKDIVAKLHSELRGITPELRERLSGMGLVPIDSPAVEQLQLYITSDIERWGKVIRAAGIPESD